MPSRGLRWCLGFERFLAAIADPYDAEHDAMLKWFGGSFDPAAVDAADLGRLRIGGAIKP